MIDLTSKKLCFVYHTPFWIDKGIVLTSHAAVGKYVDSLASFFAEIILGVPEPNKEDRPQYSLKANNLKLLHLPHYHNLQGYWFHAIEYFWMLMQSSKSWDLLNIRLPTQLGFPAFIAARLRKKPIFTIVVGEFYKYNSMSNYSFVKQKIVNIDSRIQDSLTSKIIDRCLNFVNGEELYQKYKRDKDNISLMRSSTINQEDIVKPKRKHIFHIPVQILTVSVFSSAKGCLLIPEIIFHLMKKGLIVHWHYVGKIDGNAGEREYQRTVDKSNELGVSQYFTYHGSKSWDELPRYYKNADIFALPTYVEGIPRVLLEAQANGLPVVTTTVGGIPKAILDGKNGILVPPGNAHLMADAIYHVIQNKSLFKKLVDNGIETAKELCLESETKKMMGQVIKIFPFLNS